MPNPFIIFFAISFVLMLLILYFQYQFCFRPWLRAKSSGVEVSLPNIMIMKIRGNPPLLLIDALIALKLESICVTIAEVEIEYMKNKNRIATSDDLVWLIKDQKK